MALNEIQPYVLDPESEPECEVEPQRQRLLQDTGTGRTYEAQNSNPQHQQVSIEVTLEPEPAEDHVSEAEVPTQSDEEVDVSEDDDEEEGNASSDEDWVPQSLDEEGFENLKSTSSEEDSGNEELSDNERNLRVPKPKQLCTECGTFHYSQKNHICEHKTKPYACNVCGKRCVTEYSLKVHSNIHSETYENYCKFCYSIFKTKMDKRKHEQTHQNQSRPYKCPDCEMRFALFKDRRKHMKSHRGPDEFKCDICGLAIGKKHKRRHMMIHTGAKPYKCSICERTFNQASHLKSHMRLHTGERPYKCQYCDKAFNHNVSLKSHVQRYHPLESDLLDKINEDLGEMQDGTERDNGDKVQEQDTSQTEKPKDITQRAKRPLGRPKRNETLMKNPRSKSTEDNANSSCDSQGSSDLSDFHQQEIGKAEKKVNRKFRRRNSSDSLYNPNEETFSPRKRGRPKRVKTMKKENV